MRLAKWHGLGNDYLVIDEGAIEGVLSTESIRLLCDRHLGVGSDGILLNCRPSGAVQGAVARMRVFNPDGSESEMCGNGVRIFARYLAGLGLVKDEEFVIETLAGPIRPRLVEGDRVRVDMGWARFNSDNVAAEAGEGELLEAILAAGGKQYQFTFVDVGNPHCVIQVEDPDSFDVAGVGVLIEKHPYFPNRVNVEFISVQPDGSVRMRVWERGVGETQACGTGATAVGAACARLGLVGSPVTVRLLGGDLLIEVEGGRQITGAPSLHVHMTGPAEEVFNAELGVDLLQKLGGW